MTKSKKCRQCKKEFMPNSITMVVCNWQCALKEASEKAEKKRKAENRKAKQDLKPLSKWLKETQAEFNKFIRLRDKDEPCISCQRHHRGQYHAGHYRSVGAAPELRFIEENCHKQCAPCNNHLSGNAIDYRINLINKIGLDRVECIEGPHEQKRYRIDEVKEIKKLYRDKCKEMV